MEGIYVSRGLEGVFQVFIHMFFPPLLAERSIGVLGTDGDIGYF